MPEENNLESIQYLTTAVSIICALTSLAVYHMHPKWRSHNYLYAKQIFLKCAATICMSLMILLPEDFISRDILLMMYFAILFMTVVGTVHTVMLGHIHVSLNCKEIPDEESFVAKSWYYMTADTVVVLLIIQSTLRLEYQTAFSIAGILVSAITTGNVMLLSRLFNNIERKCSLVITFILFVISLGILCDVLLILYGGLLLSGDNAGVLHDCLKVVCTGVIALITILILCSKDAMDWKNCRSVGGEDIEM